MLSVALKHSFSGFSLDVSFDVPSGLTALFGRSGSGKTSIINAISGLLHPDGGSIFLKEADNVKVLLETKENVFIPPHKRQIGYVFQDARLFPHLNVRQNLLYGAIFSGRNSKRKTEFGHIVELLGIGSLLHRHPSALSGGEKGRVALGRALLSRPKILLMDEPLAALDDLRKAEILPYIQNLRDARMLPIIYVSHSMAEVALLADHIVFIEEGKIVAKGPANTLLSEPEFAHTLPEAGSVISVRLAAHEEDGLSRLESAAGLIWVPKLPAAVGTAIRLRTRAQDVMITKTRPDNISALNVLPAQITSIFSCDGSDVLVQLRLGDEKLLARLTQRSKNVLGLEAGQEVFAVLKAASVAGENIGVISTSPLLNEALAKL